MIALQRFLVITQICIRTPIAPRIEGVDDNSTHQLFQALSAEAVFRIQLYSGLQPICMSVLTTAPLPLVKTNGIKRYASFAMNGNLTAICRLNTLS
jgi:hypothetical protein